MFVSILLKFWGSNKPRRQFIQWRCRAESATALDQFGYRFVRRLIFFVILTFVFFSLPLLARFACALRSLFDSSHPVPLFSMRSVRRLSSVCDPFYLVPSSRARVVHAFVFLVGTEAVSRDGLERDLGESKMGSTSGLRASGINASM